ncbi:MAG: OmpL47-type beta-barrel domain-containing protein [Candidatus Aenigmatarchaeota archaeon]
MKNKSFEKSLIILTIGILLTSVGLVVFMSMPSSASTPQENSTINVSPTAEKPRKPLSTETWTQTTQSDFESGDLTNLDTTTSSGEVMLDTYEFQVGAAESPNDDYYWDPGYTTFPGRDDFNIDRGGEIIEFTVTCADRHSAFKLKILRPTGNQDEYFSAETETFDPESWTIKTWDTSSDQLPIPVQGGDKLGQYTLGDLSTVGFTGENGQYYYNGEITTSPQTMDWADDDVITTMEAIVETHEDSGTLVSSVYDTGDGMYDWGTIHWDADEPSGTSLTMETRTSPDGNSWSDWAEASNGGEVPSPVDRYIQYRATFETSNGQITPSLSEVNVEYMEDTYSPEIEHDPVEGWEGYGPYTITARITDQHSGVDENSLEVRYRVDGGVWQASPMNSTTGDEYSGDIPDQDAGSEVEYYIYAVDVAGNEEKSNQYSFTIDKDPPDTSLTLQGEGPQNGWYRSDVELQFSAEDAHSGVDSILYKIDDGEWQEIDGASGGTTVSGSGTHEVQFYSIDNGGNQEDINDESFKIDVIEPTTHVALDGPEGEDGWYIGDVEVSFSSEDGYSGVDHIEYRVGEGWEEIEGDGGSITIGEEGENSLYYRAVDTAGNVEEEKLQVIRIDKTAPSVELNSPNPGGENDWHIEEPAVNISAEDGNSGVSSIKYRIISDDETGEWQKAESDVVEIKLENGEHTVEYLAENNAGLKSSDEENADTSQIKVDTQEPEIKYEISEPDSNGWYNAPPEVKIYADDEGGSGVRILQYRLGEDRDWEEYQGSFMIDREGQFYLGVRALDNAGNLNEEGKTEWLKIDLTTPSLKDFDTSDTVWKNEMTVTASIDSGASSVERVILRYEEDDGWKEKEMKRAGGEYKATISGDDVGFSDVDYQIVVEDAAGNEYQSETKVGPVGINWWYLLPIPIAVILIGLFVYWKRRREEQEKLLPVKESKFSKIRQKKGEKLKSLKKKRSTRPTRVSTSRASSSRSSPPRPQDGNYMGESGAARAGAAGMGIYSSKSRPKPSKDCDICNSPIDPESSLECQCGNAYHNDCLMVEGECLGCGRDYAEVRSFSEEGVTTEKPDSSFTGSEVGSEPVGPALDDEESEGEEELEDEVTKMLEEESESDKVSSGGIWSHKGSGLDQEEQPGSEEKTEGEVEEKEKIKCPVCNNKLEPGADKCWACGADLDEEE